MANNSTHVNAITSGIIGAAITLHREIGPGLLESAYQLCMITELLDRGMYFQTQVPVPLLYKGARHDCGYRVDLLVERLVIVELKAIERLHPVHEAQITTYLKLLQLPVGLLINFNVHGQLVHGVRRIVLDPENHYVAHRPRAEKTQKNSNEIY